MANWAEILNEINKSGSTHDVIRRQYLSRLHKLTGRNVIVYYSGWLQKPNSPGTELNDSDKNGFMNCIHKLNKDIGLDLLIHTPGGETAATESLVDYLRSVFDTNIRAIIPQLALSAGTMVACACKQIAMGKHSSLGPIDPQLQGIPAHGIVEEFNRAYNEMKIDPAKMAVWQPIIHKYPPAFIGECEKALQWSREMVKEWLLSGMLTDKEDAEAISDKIILELSDHALTKSHARHLSYQKCKQIGLDVIALEDEPKLQDAVLSVHHACIHTLSSTPAYKIIENHNGIAFIQIMRQVVVK
jgi:ClpP class serine protease